MKKIVLITGGFDPIHSGHLALIKAACELGDILVVGANSDAWLTNKKGAAFMPLCERTSVLRALKGVDFVIDFDDSDGSARHAITMVRQSYPQDKIIFANGGDRTDENIPEMDIVDDNIEFHFGVGGFAKANSSSWILQEWKAPKTNRPWGYYRVLHNLPGIKVKELTINPGQSLSMQRHKNRSELWLVSEGQCIVNSCMDSGYQLPSKKLQTFNSIEIPKNEWHQLVNSSDDPCKIVEIQYGNECEEDDIERR